MQRFLNVLFPLLFLTLSTTFAQSPDPATTRYVSTTGTNTDPESATSWAASTSDLQGAINSLPETGGEVWVAAGLYLPTTSDGPGVSFSMRNNVAIYGGFVGNETSLSNRPSVNPNTGNPSIGAPSGSTLSGDIGIPNDNSDNSYHIIWNDALTTTAILDGFVIVGGNANDPQRSTNRIGGGMYNRGDGTTCTPTIRNCLFLANTASELGGAIYNSGNASPTFVNCQFRNNTAILGGAIYNASQNSSTNHILTNCLFDSNIVTEEGGGIYSNGEAGSCTVLLTNCSFQDNSAKVGGGISTSNGSMTAINCSFQGNVATQKGGALFTIQASSFLLNCAFWNNGNNKSIQNESNGVTTASYSLFDNTVANYTATNSLTTSTSPFASTTSTQLYVNSPALDAGDPTTTPVTGTPAAVGTTDLAGNDRFYRGLLIDVGAYEYSLPRLVGILQQPVASSVVCAGKTVTAAISVSGNVANYQWYKEDLSGGATALTSPSSATSASLTLTDVTTASTGTYFVVVTGIDNSVTSTSFSLTVNAVPPLSISANPSLTIGFFDSATLTASGASSYTWSTGQFSTSIAANVAGTYSVTGVSNGCSSTASAVLTITANCGSVIYVTEQGGTTRDGRSWATAYAGTELQLAIDLAFVCGAQVWVASGTYKPTTTTNRTISFAMKNNVAIYGGFLGSETALSGRPTLDPTTGNPSSSTLSGDIDNDGLLDGENTYHVIANTEGLTSSAILDGFVITGGQANGNWENGHDSGAGMHNSAEGADKVCSPLVRYCLFQDNYATSVGAAMYALGTDSGTSSPQIFNCVFRNNAASSGGAIFNYAYSLGVSSPQLMNCIFERNSVTNTGGAIYNYGYNGTSMPQLTNCSFQNNTSGIYGGAVYSIGYSGGTSSPQLTNCSFQSNTATNTGGAVYNYGWNGTSNSTLTNCVFWNNGGNKTLYTGSQSGSSSMSVNYCLFDQAVTGYTSANSLTTSTSPFLSATSTQLNACSPAINAGLTSASGLNGISTDLAGNGRIFNSVVDMGAYEFRGTTGQFMGITAQPVASSIVSGGSTVTAFVSVSGTGPFTYQWYKNGAAINDQTSATLSLSAVTCTNMGSYLVVVTGTCNSVTSTAFSLSVNYSLTVSIAATPPNLIINSLESATLTASGATSYTWSTGQTSATIVVNAEATYSVTGVSDGCTGVASAVLTVTANCNSIIHVTPSGGVSVRDGNSWATAYAGTQLQQAFNRAHFCGAQVWIAAGTYKPTSDTAAQNVSFSMKDGVTIYGGFVGDETDLSQRPPINPVAGRHSNTILSGDIDGDGTPARNSRNVFRHSSVNSTAVLDGVVITAGYAYDPTGNSTTKRGGGMANFGSNPTITNCTFRSNTAVVDGGAIYNQASSPVLTNCVLENNYAGDRGGAIATRTSSSNTLVLTNCVLQSNTAVSEGGALHLLVGGEATLTNCILQNNKAINSVAGAIYAGGTDVSATNCVLRNNSAYRGGAFCISFSYFSLTNCTLQNNSAQSSGGVMFSLGGSSSLSLTNSIVWGNVQGNDDSFDNSDNTPYTTRYNLFDESATGYTSDPTNLTSTVSPFISATSSELTACSPAIDAGDPATTSAVVGLTDLAGNARFFANGRIDMGAYEFQAASDRTGITQQPASGSSVCIGSIVTVAVSASGVGNSYQWYKDGNLLTGLASATTATLSLSNVQNMDVGSYSVIITGSCNSVTSTAFSLIVNPSLTVSIAATPPNLIINSLESATLTTSGATSYTWSTGQTSATIVVNAEATYSVTGVIDGCSAVASAVLTVTANCNSIIHVTPSGGVSVRDGNSWATAYAGTQLQQAINRAAFCGAQVWIAAGTYKPTSNTDAQNVSFSMKDGVSIYGGFVGDETVLSQRPPINPVAGRHSNTILSGDIDGDGTPARNSYHVFRQSGLNSTAVMDGVVITAAYSSDGTGENKRGAGMVNLGSSPTLTNCTFQSNTTLSDGGAMYNKGSTPKLTNCVFDNNYGERGGAITWSLGGGIEMTNCVLQNNKASQYGGAFFVLGGTATLTNCLLQNNHADGKGGVAYGTATFLATNCVFRANTTAEGGVFWSYGNRTTLTNCTVQGNHSTGSGGFMYSLAGAVTVLTNSILWDNSDNKGEIFYDNNTPPLVTATYCLFDADAFISDPTNLSTSISPFVSTTSSELTACSPAIDAGDPATTSAVVGLTDLAGNNRFFANGRVDMGAYEFQAASDRTGITQQPASGSSVCIGSTLSLAVSASGVGNTYQWYKDNNVLTGLASATTATLSLSNVQNTDVGTYSVVVTGTCNSVTSTAFSLTVNSQPTPLLTATPNATLTCAQTSLTLLATGGTSYAFAHLEGGGISSQNPGSGTAIIHQAGTYSVTVTGAHDCIASTTILVSRNTTPPVASLHSSGSITCGSTSTLTASGGVSYTLLNDSRSNTTGIFPITAPSTYTVAVTGSNGCTATSLTMVTSSSPMAILQQPVAGSAICTGSTITASVSISGTGPFTYQWYKNGSLLNGQTSATLTLSNVQVTATGNYVAVVMGPCNSLTSTVFSLSVNDYALTPSVSNFISSGPLGAQHCQVRLSAIGVGQSFIFTGPGGYVFSNVYRRAGSYPISAERITQPGTYTLTIYSGPGCDGIQKTASYPIQVTGTACP